MNLAGAAVLSPVFRVRGWLGQKDAWSGRSLRHNALDLWYIVAAPQHQYYLPEELAAWFTEEQFDNIQDTTIPDFARSGFGLLGIRSKS